MIRSFFLAACLAAPMMAQAETTDLTDVTMALDWTLNTNHIGLVVARDKGFYAQEGLNVDLLPYSDTSSAALLAAIAIPPNASAATASAANIILLLNMDHSL